MEISSVKGAALLAAWFGLSVGCCAQEASAQSDIIRGKQDAYVMLPAKAIGASKVVAAEWSPDGDAIVFVSESIEDLEAAWRQTIEKGSLNPPTHVARTTLSIWNMATQKRTTLWSGGATRVGELKWLKGSPVGVALLHTYRQNMTYPEGGVIIRFHENGEAQVVKEVHRKVGYSEVWLAVNPTEPYAIAGCHGDDGFAAWVISPNGNRGITFREPRAMHFPSQVLWTEDSKPLIYDFQTSDAKRPLLVDLATGGLTEVQGTVKRYIAKPEPEERMRIVVGSAALDAQGRATTERLVAALLAGDDPNEPPAIVCGDLSGVARLSPAQTAVFFITQGALFVRPIVKVSREKLDQTILKDAKQKVMMKSKMAVLTLLIFASDHDDRLPSLRSDWSAGLLPYLKDRNQLEGFTYTFAGGSIRDLDDPARTQIGFVQGPGGFAVAFADGHVEWKKEL